MAEEELTPLGELIEQARGSLSKREAARLAGISEGRWRQVVTGKQKVGGGIVAQANPRRETVIAMAEAVQADVNEALRRAGMAEQAISVPGDTRGDEGADVGRDELEAAILRSDRLIDEAKQHLLNQYALLLRVPPLRPSVPKGKQGPRRPDTSGETERRLRPVARGGDPKDRAEVSRRARRVREEHENKERGSE